MKNVLVPVDTTLCNRLQITFICSSVTKKLYQKVYPKHVPTDEELARFWTSYPDYNHSLAAWFRSAYH
jgi:hypothetical protein